MDILNVKEAAAYLRISRSTLYDILREDQTFPRPIALTETRRAYVKRELDDWLAARVADRDTKVAA